MRLVDLHTLKFFEHELFRTIVAVILSSAVHTQPVFSGSYDGPASGGWDNSLNQSPSEYLINRPSKIPAWSPATLTTAELHALRSLCLAGIHANGIWGSDRINIAIAYLAFGSKWPDSPSATAYKICSYSGSIHPRKN